MTNADSIKTQHKARKRFGQNFLIDEGVINHIVRSVSPKDTDNLLEIGPGKGAITGLLLERCPRLNVIELDRNLIPRLLTQFAKYADFNVHQADALSVDFRQYYSEECGPLRIVGNLPYNITTPLIFHLLSFDHIINDMHFMLQKEVVARLSAHPGEKNYGRLTVMAQYFCNIEHLFDVPPESFRPVPKVDSAVVRLTPHPQRPSTARQFEHFERLVRTAFQQRRKTLRNALKSIVEADKADSLDIDLSQRAENLSVGDYVEISNTLLARDLYEK